MKIVATGTFYPVPIPSAVFQDRTTASVSPPPLPKPAVGAARHSYAILPMLARVWYRTH